jgi:hypothetical protein
MENPKWSKCKCVHCGHTIHYRLDDDVSTVVCPKCEAKALIPSRRTVESEPPKSNACRHRPASLLRHEEPCAECEAEAKQQRQKTILTVAGIALVAVAVLGIGGVLLWKLAQPSQPAAVVLPQPPIQPQIKTPKSLDNLAAGRFAVHRDGTNMIVSGDVHNLSEHLHRNVTAYLDVFDARGQKIGEVSNAIVELNPKSVWRVVARTGDTNVVSGRWNRFSEQP